MSTLAESLGEIKKPWQWIALGGAVLLIWGVVAFPRMQSMKAPVMTEQIARTEPAERLYPAAPPMSGYVATAQPSEEAKAKAVVASPPADAAAGRKIVRTSSIELVVPHPAEAADRITALAESLGGYLASADGGGENAVSGMVTIRVPAARFEEARAAIRKLGLRVESEKVDAQDVTRQYVDQDASIRNLQAEEAGYLAILKQANTVKDMLAVTQRLSEVRGQIEQQQAEFNALSRQIETVSLAISLRTEAEAQTFGLNWRPGYQLKVAMHDGLESLGNYATAMATILFYLPATLLWAGTILAGIVIGWRTVRWVGRRWFGWVGATAQG